MASASQSRGDEPRERLVDTRTVVIGLIAFMCSIGTAVSAGAALAASGVGWEIVAVAGLSTWAATGVMMTSALDKLIR